MDKAELAAMYPLSVLEDQGYYKWHERDFNWYFDPEFCENAGFEDYQRLVLRNNVSNNTCYIVLLIFVVLSSVGYSNASAAAWRPCRVAKRPMTLHLVYASKAQACSASTYQVRC